MGAGTVGLTTSVVGQDSQSVQTTGPQAVPAVTDATISGTTNLPDTTTLSVRIRSSAGVQPSFRFRKETTPTEGTWSITIDLSIIEPGAQFTLAVQDDEQRYLDETWDVIDPDQQFTVDSVELRSVETGSIITHTSDDGWTDSIESVETGDTRSFQVRTFEDGNLVYFPRAGSVEVETTGGLQTNVATETFSVTATEAGTREITITIQSTYGGTYQSPPLAVDVVAPQETATNDSTSTNESAPTVEEQNETDAKSSNESAPASTDKSEPPAQEADETTGSVPGFTGIGALAGIVGFVSLFRQRLKGEQTE